MAWSDPAYSLVADPENPTEPKLREVITDDELPPEENPVYDNSFSLELIDERIGQSGQDIINAQAALDEWNNRKTIRQGLIDNA